MKTTTEQNEMNRDDMFATPYKKGDKVRVQAGAILGSTHDKKKGHVVKRNYVVSVHACTSRCRLLGYVTRWSGEGVVLDEDFYGADKAKYFERECKQFGVKNDYEFAERSDALRELCKFATLVPVRSHVDADGILIESFEAYLNVGKYDVEWISSGYYVWTEGENVEPVIDESIAITP